FCDRLGNFLRLGGGASRYLYAARLYPVDVRFESRDYDGRFYSDGLRLRPLVRQYGKRWGHVQTIPAARSFQPRVALGSRSREPGKVSALLSRSGDFARRIATHGAGQTLFGIFIADGASGRDIRGVLARRRYGTIFPIIPGDFPVTCVCFV